MQRFYRQHKEKVNYLLIGGWNTLFGYFTFVGLYFWLHSTIHYIILLVISNILSITNAYIGYKIFVFRTKGNYLQEYIRFYLVYGVAILFNLVLLPVTVEMFNLSPPLAQGIIIWLTVIFSYFGHKHFSFKKHE